jgi:hypothetical protein
VRFLPIKPTQTGDGRFQGWRFHTKLLDKPSGDGAFPDAIKETGRGRFKKRDEAAGFSFVSLNAFIQLGGLADELLLKFNRWLASSSIIPAH